MEQISVSFTTIKEKIIRTDQLLNLLKNFKHDSKEWKKKYNQSLITLQRTQLESERYTKNFEELKLKQKTIQDENKSLTEQNAFLEDRYNKQMIESMKTIKNLQDDLQMIQELKTEASNSTISNQKLHDQISDLSSDNNKLKEKNKTELRQLQNQIEEYIKEMTKLKSQITSIQNKHNKDKQQLQILEKQISTLIKSKEKYEKVQQENKSLTDELLKIESELRQLKCTYIDRKVHNSYVQTDDLQNKCTSLQTESADINKEVHNSYVQTEEIYEKINQGNKPRFSNTENAHQKKEVHNTYSQTDFVEEMSLNHIVGRESKFSQTDIPPISSSKRVSETQHVSVQTNFGDTQAEFYLSDNKKLAHKVELYEETIKLLKDEMKQPKINAFSQTEFTEIELDEEINVNDILREMLILPFLSPISSDEDLIYKRSATLPPAIPSVVITPSIPTENNDSIIPETMELDNDIINDTKNQTPEKPISIGKEEYSTLKPVRNPKNKMCFSYNDYIRQQSWLLRQRKLAFKKKLNQRRRKSTLPTDGLMNSLNALKKSNIKFIISNDSTLPQYPSFFTDLYDNHKHEHQPEDKLKPKPIKKQFNVANVPPQCIKTLQCESDSCKQTCMLVNKTREGNELLGFFTNNADITPTVHYTEQMPFVNQSDPISTLKKDVSSNIIEQIAKIVCEKLKDDCISLKKPETSPSTTKYFDSFGSETETEIERLFKKPQFEIRQQNKGLMDEANYCSTDVSALSNIEDTFSETRSDTASIFGEQSSFHCSETSVPYVPLLAAENAKSKTTNKNCYNEILDCFKVPICPQLLSPIYSTPSTDFNKSPKYLPSPTISSYPTVTNSINSSPKPTSGKKLVFNSPQKSCNQEDISVNSNVSYYIDKILQDRKNMSYNLNRFIGTLSGDLLDKSLQKSIAGTENVSGATGHPDVCVKSLDPLQSCAKFGVATEPPDKSAIHKSNTNENTSQKSSSLTEANIRKLSRISTISKNITQEKVQSSSEDSQINGNDIDENDRLRCVDNDCLDPSDHELSSTTETQKRHKSLNRCQARRLKRLGSPSDVIKRKRLKSLPLESSESEEDSMESPKSPENNFDKGLKLDEPLQLGLLDREENSIKTPESPTENFEKRMQLEAVRNIGRNIVDSSTLEKHKDVYSDVKKTPAKLVTSSDKPLVIRKKTKTASKLKLRVLQQMKCARSMMGTRKSSDVANCDILVDSVKIKNNSKDPPKLCVDSPEHSTISQTKNINEDEGIGTDHSETHSLNDIDTNNIPDSSKCSQTSSNCSTEMSDNNKKIHIVQNILIPPKSRFAIDLLENNRKLKQTNSSSDILCQILHNMDKDKPIIKKEFSKEGSDNIPVSVDDKRFRNNVLDIAETLHNGIKFCDYQYKNLPSRDKSVLESKILLKGKNLPLKIVILLSRLYKSLEPGTPIRDDVVYEFMKLDVEDIADIILNQAAKDFEEKPSLQYVDAPLMTKKQNILLCLMLKLEKEKHREMVNTFLCRTEQYLFYKGCSVKSCAPIVRLYLALCRLRGDITRVRKFLSDAFYLINEGAIIICFTVLTNWVDVMPKWENWQSFPLSKVIFQVIHLKTENRPGLKLFPLKCLLAQYYGYPKERLNCDELFKELYHLYLNGPSAERELAIRLLLKHKPKPWVYEKLNQVFKPLVYKIPSENVNFKATVIIFMGKICQYFRTKVQAEEVYLTELRRWFLGLTEDNAPQLIVDSVHYVLEKLPKKKFNFKAKPINTQQN